MVARRCSSTGISTCIAPASSSGVCFRMLQLQRLLNAGTIGERVTPELLEQLVAAGLPSRLSAGDFATLQHVGVFNQECRFADGRIGLPVRRHGSKRISAIPKCAAELASIRPRRSPAQRRAAARRFLSRPEGILRSVARSAGKRAAPVQHDERRLHQSAVRARHGTARRATPACPLHQYRDDDDADSAPRYPTAWRMAEW